MGLGDERPAKLLTYLVYFAKNSYYSQLTITEGDLFCDLVVVVGRGSGGLK